LLVQDIGLFGGLFRKGKKNEKILKKGVDKTILL
jgi:hypothetical protein